MQSNPSVVDSMLQSSTLHSSISPHSYSKLAGNSIQKSKGALHIVDMESKEYEDKKKKLQAEKKRQRA